MSNETEKRPRRVPQCARCRSHNTFASVRGHKSECQWKDCTCAKCLQVTEKRRVTAVRVAVLRRERKRNMSHRMQGLGAFHSWGMMRRVPGEYPPKYFPDNQKLAVPGESYYIHEMLHTKYREMYTHGAKYHMYPRECLPHGLPCYDDEPKTPVDSGVSQSLRNFQHEYESFMKQNGKSSPSYNFEMRSSNSSPGFQNAQRVPQLFFGESHITHGDVFLPRLPHERQRYLPLMLNTTHTLPCPFPVRTSKLPYGVCK